MTLAAISTGVDSFRNPAELGPLYPFPGFEWLFLVVGVALWLLWHVVQIRGESRENERAAETYAQIGLDRVMFYGGSADVPGEEEWEEAQRLARHAAATMAGEPAAHADAEVETRETPPGLAT